MKITSVEIWEIQNKTFQFDHPIIVRVNTDEGISGLGEVGLAYGTGHSAGIGYVKNLAESYLIGADPMKAEKLWDTMFTKTFWAQGGGPVVYAGMSAVDIACWDIKGKALGVPIYQLLGGKTNETLRAYASQLQTGWSEGDYQWLVKPEEYAEAARAAVRDGYDAIKVDPISFGEDGSRPGNMRQILDNRTVRMAHNRIKAMREAVGDDVDILIELHGATSLGAAIQLGKAFEEFNCMFFEEGVHYLNPKLQKKLSDEVDIPMAAGERLYTRWGYREYFENQSLAMIQPDLCLVGGITEGKKICDYAHVYDVTVQLHVCGTPITTAAALQLEAVIPNFQIHEHHVRALKSSNRILCVQDYQPVNGHYEIPDLPGLGIDLDEKVVSKSPRIVVK